MTDLKDLKELAEAATQGRWGVENPFGDDLLAIVANPEAQVYDWLHVAQVPLDDPSDGPAVSKAQLKRNAAFIAAANPKTVLELIARVEAAEGETKQLRDDQQRAITYLTQLLTSVWPGTRALEKLNPLISQIDNGLTELKNLRDHSFEKDEDDVRAYEEALDVGREEADEEIQSLRTALEQAKAREAELRSALERLSGILLKHEQEARSLLDYEEDTGISDMREALIAVVFNDDGQDFLHTVRFAENAVTAMGGDDNG